MDITILLALLGLGALFIPVLGGDDDGDDDEENIIRGTPEADELDGTSEGETILGFLGDDVINGNGGLDTLEGSGGEDIITGGEDRDVIRGGADDDQLFGLGGNDTIEGGGGIDRIEAGEGNDIVRAGDGNDVVFGFTGTDVLRGEDDDDDIFLWGEGGRALGGDGDDELVMVTGRGVLEGVAGTNTFYALANDDDEQQTVAIIEDFGVGDEIVMTIDTSDITAASADLQVTVTEGTINGTDGFNIEVSFANEGDEPDETEFETARVFVLGTQAFTAEQIAASVKVDVTVDAGLSVEEAEDTFEEVKANATAPAVTDPVIVV
ncbi:MAG: calcium-binding protein [Pseudomonadota bacterium]